MVLPVWVHENSHVARVIDTVNGPLSVTRSSRWKAYSNELSDNTTRRIYVLANVDVPHHGVVERSVVGASRAT